MPSTLGSAELTFAKKSVSFTTSAETFVSLRVREKNIHRKLFLAVVPNGGTFADYYWRGRVEFRLKGVPVAEWKLAFTSAVDTGPDAFAQSSPLCKPCPPYWIETFSADGANWPVVAPQPDEQVVVLEDTNDAVKYHVHMLPVKFTGHFDEIAFLVQQWGTVSAGEANAYLVAGCLSQPVGD